MRGKKNLFAALLVVALAACAHVAYAADDQAGYEPVNGNMMQPGEVIPGGRMVVVAYSIVFVAIAGYGIALTLKTARLQREIELLKQKLG